MLSDKPFRKEDLDLYLKELAKEFRKRNGITIHWRMTAEQFLGKKTEASA